MRAMNHLVLVSALVVTFDRAKPLRVASAPADFDQSSLMLMGAAVRAVATAGALEALLGLTVRYANERVAFERPIGKFQAVQHMLADMANSGGLRLDRETTEALAFAQARRSRAGRYALVAGAAALVVIALTLLF